MKTALRLTQLLPFVLLMVGLGFAVVLAGNDILSLGQRLFFVALMAALAIFTALLTPATVTIPSPFTWFVSLLLTAVWPVVVFGLTPSAGQWVWFGFLSQAYVVLVLLPLFVAIAQPKDYDAWRHRFDDKVYGRSA